MALRPNTQFTLGEKSILASAIFLKLSISALRRSMTASEFFAVSQVSGVAQARYDV